MAIYFTRNVTREAVLLFIQRLEEAKSGIFTVISSVIAFIVTILAALQRVWGQ
jgi:hypothetical protein